jgi:myo-inositol-1(or 4)-monophosphatase
MMRKKHDRSQNISKELVYLIGITKEVGSLLKKKFYQTLSFKKKKDGSWVSEADIYSDRLIRKKLMNFFPKHSIISEESGGNITDKTIWVDPLDGTTNYKLGFPFFCISIGIVENKKAIKGVIYNPTSEELFYAEKDKGAFLEFDNQLKRLSVSNTYNLNNSSLVFELNHRGGYIDEIRDLYKKLQAEVSYTRQTGCCALDICYVAAGIFDAAIFGNNGYGYDVAAGCIIIEEAGGKVSNFSGKNIFQEIKETNELIQGGICSNKNLYSRLKSFINNNFKYYN